MRELKEGEVFVSMAGNKTERLVIQWYNFYNNTYVVLTESGEDSVISRDSVEYQLAKNVAYIED